MNSPNYCCPRCKGALLQDGSKSDSAGVPVAYRCTRCDRNFPVIAGIADFRVYPDPYIDLEEDRRKGLHLAEQSAKMTFAELVAFYYSITPEVPNDLAAYYLNHHIAGTIRGAGILDRFSAYGLPLPSSRHVVLDLGCGTGGFLAAAAQNTDATLIGVDVAFRWLIVTRKRLEELGCNDAQLVCACADYLPFPDQSFDAIVAENVIEHLRDQAGLFAEIARVRRADSSVMARTVNRYAVGPEPHVGVWGVGFLPRRMMNAYVKLVKGIPYEHIHLQSARDLHASVASSGQADLRVRCAILNRQDYQHHRRHRQELFRLYSRLANNIDVLRPVLTNLGPYLDVVSKARVSTEPNTPVQQLVPTGL
jgi:SAM-dependent methyltransferase